MFNILTRLFQIKEYHWKSWYDVIKVTSSFWICESNWTSWLPVPISSYAPFVINFAFNWQMNKCVLSFINVQIKCTPLTRSIHISKARRAYDAIVAIYSESFEVVWYFDFWLNAGRYGILPSGKLSNTFVQKLQASGFEHTGYIKPVG